MLRFGLLLGVCLTLFAGCASYPPPERPAADLAAPYRLDSGDRLRVIIFGQPNLSGEYTVDDGGSISMPLLAPVAARALSLMEFKDRLAAALGQTLLRNPSVSVEVLEFRPFFILGEVNSPGKYSYVTGMSVMTAVATAGGFTYRAARRSASVTRTVDGGQVTMRVGSQANVLPGDTIVISERYF